MKNVMLMVRKLDSSPAGNPYMLFVGEETNANWAPFSWFLLDGVALEVADDSLQAASSRGTCSDRFDSASRCGYLGST